MSEFIWTTGKGQKLKLCEMSSSHLQNTINYLRRRAEEEQSAYWSAGSYLQGEMALDSWESQQDQETEKYNDRMAVVQLMEDELERRRKFIEEREKEGGCS